MADPLGRLQAVLVDRYTIDRELGRGGMATVYLARDLKHDRRVALKVLHPELAFTLGPERFQREIKLAARLQHPHILTVLDSGEAAGQLWYTMPFAEGESLRERLTRERQLPLDDALQITREVADALGYAHSQGIIHRDIKPENILLSRGHALVADFGVARALRNAAGERLTETGIAVGTPTYMSPEQATAERDLDPRSDIYSLGCVLYEMLAGEPPYTGPSAQAVLAKRFNEPLPHIRTVRESVPEAIEKAVSKALATSPADRFATAAQFAAALAAGTVGAPSGARRRARRFLVAGTATVVVAALALTILRPRIPSRAPLDPNLVAVAPFDVFDPKLGLWHEGLMDVLSRNLDGEGPLRTVPPTVVVRRWRGPADPASAAELARSTGARVVLFGGIIGAGPDSARVTATVFDAGAARALAEVELPGTEDRMDRLSDSLTVVVLRALGRTRPIGAVRLASLGSTSRAATKAFLTGEQFYRRGVWDSAIAYSRQAVALDSTFALALRRVGTAQWWWGADTSYITYLLRAGAHNHGLAPRESLLVAADSAWGALSRANGPPYWPWRRRFFRVLEDAVRRYPDDPEIWYHRCELAVHVGLSRPPVPLGPRDALEACERAIELDSAFAPAYVHGLELVLAWRGPAAARRLIAEELTLNLTPERAAALHLVDKLLDPSAAQSSEISQMLDTLSPDALSTVQGIMTSWPDSAETAVRLGRLLTLRRGYHFLDSGLVGWTLAAALASRGHLRQASTNRRWTTVWPGPLLAAELAYLGAIPRDSTAALFGHWLRTNNRWVGVALVWWATTGDSNSIQELRRRADSLARASGDAEARHYWRSIASVSRPCLALARHDSAAALEGFVVLADSNQVEDTYTLLRLQRIELLARLDRTREAAELLDHHSGGLPMGQGGFGTRALWALERGRVFERLGQRDNAIAGYSFVADYWRNADPELQPYVTEARAALKRLSGVR